ncbi:FecR family protein [Dawidia soli]|uniref:FecR domain-containing protein n=1 Tax=Dawidia soli TaxID=2782352 RepID=A0AAP2GHD8_9BACT|nr:FecR domain-containing protein [Dawidia soli]MBT1687111.1 FecR domain-containing protein [Dawidia soli]
MEEFSSLRDKIQNNTASDAEVEKFMLHVRQMLEEERGRSGEPLVGAELDDVMAGIWQKTAEGAAQNRRQPIFTRVRFVRLMAAATLVALLGASLYVFWPDGVPSLTDAGAINRTVYEGRNYIRLPDGSTIELNEGSTLFYDSDFGKTNRVVTLDGQGYFDVAHDPDKPFLVKSPDVVVTVLGTAFDVRAYAGEDVTVTVSRGKVKVGNETEVFGELLPDQQLTYHRKSARTETRALAAGKALDWKADFLILDDVTVGEALDKIADRFHVRVAFDDEAIRGCKVRIAFVHRESLDDMLGVLEAITRARFQVHDNVISVAGGEPCV